MRDGKPCGLKMMSGIMPDSVNGMSSAGHNLLEYVIEMASAELMPCQGRPEHTLLPMAAGKFITNDRCALQMD